MRFFNHFGAKFQLIVFAVMLVSSLASCKKENYTVDLDETVQAPAFARFGAVNGTLSYFYPVMNNGAPTKIPISITNVKNEDREIKFTYTSKTGAINGTHYTAPASIVIKAGSSVDTLAMQGIFSAYNATRRDTVLVKFDNLKGVDRQDSFQLVLKKYCDVILSQLSGTYANTNEYSASTGALSWGPYQTKVKNLVATSATTATGLFEGLYDEDWGDISFTMDWTDPTNFKITIPFQATGSAGSVKFVQGASSSFTTTTIINSFNSCDQEFTLSIARYTSATATATSTPASGNYRFVLKR